MSVAATHRLDRLCRIGVDQIAFAVCQRGKFRGTSPQDPDGATIPVDRAQPARRQIAKIDWRRIAGWRPRPIRQILRHANPCPERAERGQEMQTPASRRDATFLTHSWRLDRRLRKVAAWARAAMPAEASPQSSSARAHAIIAGVPGHRLASEPALRNTPPRHSRYNRGRNKRSAQAAAGDGRACVD